MERKINLKPEAGLAKLRLRIVKWRMTQTPEWRLHQTAEWRFELYAMSLGNWAKHAFPGRVMLRREVLCSRITFQIGLNREAVTINVAGPVGNVTFIVSQLNIFRLHHTLTPIDNFPNGYRVLSDCGIFISGAPYLCSMTGLKDYTSFARIAKKA